MKNTAVSTGKDCYWAKQPTRAYVSGSGVAFLPDEVEALQKRSFAWDDVEKDFCRFDQNIDPDFVRKEKNGDLVLHQSYWNDDNTRTDNKFHFGTLNQFVAWYL